MSQPQIQKKFLQRLNWEKKRHALKSHICKQYEKNNKFATQQFLSILAQNYERVQPMKQNYMLEFIKEEWEEDMRNLKESKSYSFCV